MAHAKLRRALPVTAAAAALIATGSILAAAGAATAPGPGTIETIAGGPGGPAPATSVSVQPCGVEFVRGALYIGSRARLPYTSAPSYPAVYRVNPDGGQLTTVVGQGVVLGQGPDVGLVRDGALASTIAVDACNATVDQKGNLLLSNPGGIEVIPARTGTYYLREKMLAGRAYTVGGAYLTPTDVEVDRFGNMVVVMRGGGPPSSVIGGQVTVLAVRTGTFYGVKMTAGDTYVIAGVALRGLTGNGARAVNSALGYAIGTAQFDSDGNLLLADMAADYGENQKYGEPPPRVRVIPDQTGTYYGQHMVAGDIYTIAGGGTLTGNGVAGPKAALAEAAAVALDRAGNVLIADYGRVRVLAKKSGTFYGQKMTAGRIYTIAGTGAAGPLTLGRPATKAVLSATGLAVDSDGNVLIADEADARVLMIAASGVSYGVRTRAGYLYSIVGNGLLHYSGDGRPATSAEVTPLGVADDGPAGLVVFPDRANVVRVVAGRTGSYFGQAMTGGDIYTIAGDGAAGYSGDGGRAVDADLGDPTAAAADPAGNILLADDANYRVRVVAAQTGSYYGRAMTGGDIYTIVGDGAAGYSGDGGPAVDAGLGPVTSVAADQAGNVFLVGGESGTPGEDPRVRMVAETTGTYFGQAMTAGRIYTVAGDGNTGYSGDGGLATAANMQLEAVAVDNAGNLVTADANRVRVVAVRTGSFYGQAMTAGHIYTVAGGGTQTGDGVPATSAQVDAFTVTVDPAGNVLLGGTLTVRMVAEETGTYYGQKVLAGDIYTVAGEADGANAGVVEGASFQNGGPATSALMTPAGIAIGPAGSLLIADRLYNRIRSVTR